MPQRVSSAACRKTVGWVLAGAWQGSVRARRKFDPAPRPRKLLLRPLLGSVGDFYGLSRIWLHQLAQVRAFMLLKRQIEDVFVADLLD
jgi:hypothetical protein